jgi:hypothetical protein
MESHPTSSDKPAAEMKHINHMNAPLNPQGG